MNGIAMHSQKLRSLASSLLMPPKSIQPCHIFMIFYSVALVTDFDRQTYAAGIILFLSLWVAMSPSRLSFLAILVASTVYFVWRELPDTENHTNLIMFTNTMLILGILYSYALENFGSAEIYYEIVQPVIRLSIVVAFAVAGIHKLNYDFINPDVSCIAIFTDTIFNVVTSVDFIGIGLTPLVFLLLMPAVLAVMLWRQTERCMPPIDWTAIGGVLLILLSVMSLLAIAGANQHIDSFPDLAIFVVAVAVLCWQLIEAPLLLIARFQWVALIFSLLVHAQLAVMRIVDFQAIAVALLVAFVPLQVWQGWDRKAYASIGPIRLHRAHLYYLLNVIGALIMLAHVLDIMDWPRPLTAWGVLFVAGLLVMLWPIISDLFSPTRTWRWTGVRVLNRVTPTWLYAVPLGLLLFGMTSHLGLRTAGNLSMYSNLRTEFGQNNHLLLGSNPLKWFGYQEDVVHILDVGETATIGPYLNRWGLLEGNRIPVVEFRKKLTKWRRDGEVVPMTVEYEGRTTRSPNIVESPEWQVAGWDWEMRLMDFRVIQSEPGPNRCRW